jgi:C-terminal processing protease CtpA/Prc
MAGDRPKDLYAHHDSVLDLQLPYPNPVDCSITRVQGRCAVGDQIVDVDGESIKSLDKRAIAQLLRRVTLQKDALLITIVRVDKVT